MKFGLFGGATVHGSDSPGDSSRDYLEFIDYVVEAEALGFHSVFLVEHHFTGFNQVSSALTLLTYLAAKTERIRLGTAVTVLPWHNPILLAEQAATLDLLSNGRLDLGVGKGYRHNEFHGFCVPIEESHERYVEALEVIKKAWTSSGRFSHHGKRWNFENVIVEPETTQKPHPPLWVGAGSPPSIKAAADDGFNLLLDQFANEEQLGERITAYRKGLEAGGRTYIPTNVGVTRALHVAMNARERDEAHALRGQFLHHVQKLATDPRKLPQSDKPASFAATQLPTSEADTRAATERVALIGTPDEIVERLDRLRAAGVEYVLLIDVGGSRAALRAFAGEVMPAFADNARALSAA